ncbi:ABC transporter substrate-binding protein [Phytoactinopolyspora mesophila]|uniref:Peptide ABC transporter substrate-binding protein n=1 Tax=Phytoactinopolyspora mesophila TaxID=2650750 RepID=A0A7K3LWX1_9ACTN|nr:ABC transporter substrate-binding protein [Phytoactinopolyspora mesophila]NDL55511.1 peptide ABC transporter substrate-binding protein [Phytoactinopolyspora mesophila]
MNVTPDHRDDVYQTGLRATNRALTRRQALLGGAAVAMSAALAACGSSNSSGTTSAGETAGAAASPSRGGRIRAAFAGGGAQETLDPHRANLFLEGSRSKMIFEKLADYGDDMAAVPRLAEEWSHNDELTEWTVKLRQATFHDGSPVTADDVLYSYARIVDPDEGFRARANLEMLDIAKSAAVDERTVRLVLSRPYAEFPNSMAAFGAFIVPSGAEEFADPIGSGPFRFEEWTPGSSLGLVSFDDYWEGRPYIDELEYLITNEETARINALLGGQVEYAHDISPASGQSHQDRDGVIFINLPNSGMNGFVMKVDRAPFDDPDVRRALFLLTNRQELVDAAIGGAGTIGNDLFGQGYEYYADHIPQRELDLDEATRLIEKAGASGAEITIDTADVGTGMVASASVFADQMRAAGLNVTVNNRDGGTYWSDILTEGHLATFRSGGMPIESHISQRLLSTSSTNATRWQRPEFDARYQEAISTADAGIRAEIYHELQETLHEEGGLAVWGFADWIVATGSKVHGVQPSPANSLDWARFDKVWVA